MAARAHNVFWLVEILKIFLLENTLWLIKQTLWPDTWHNNLYCLPLTLVQICYKFVDLCFLFLLESFMEQEILISHFWDRPVPIFSDVRFMCVLLVCWCTFSRLSCKQCELFPLHVNQKSSSVFLCIAWRLLCNNMADC
jgi:hypothetical protein